MLCEEIDSQLECVRAHVHAGAIARVGGGGQVCCCKRESAGGVLHVSAVTPASSSRYAIAFLDTVCVLGLLLSRLTLGDGLGIALVAEMQPAMFCGACSVLSAVPCCAVVWERAERQLLRDACCEMCPLVFVCFLTVCLWRRLHHAHACFQLTTT